MSAAEWADEVTRRWALLVDEVHRRLGPGVSLSPPERERYARRMGFDFAAATVHRGPLAAGLAGAVGASAVTAGEHVAGGEPELDPATAAGEALLGHELAHVAQQSAPMALAPPPVLGRRSSGHAGADAGGGTGSGLVLQRDPDGESGANGSTGEAQALSVEAAVLQTARGGGQRRPPPDPEQVAELVYRRLRDALRDEQQRTA